MALTIVCHVDAVLQINQIKNVTWANVRMIPLANSGQKLGIPDYNRLLTSPEFWSRFESRFVLITHIDTAIFRKLDDWMFDYEIMGAPWRSSVVRGEKPQVGNGGYSLRNVNSMKVTLDSQTYSVEHPHASFPEDMWWNRKIHNLPNELKALEFSAENFALDDFIPTGAHQLSQKGHIMIKIAKAFRELQQYGRCI